MKNDFNFRSNFLDKANGATSILAILSAVAALPGGLNLYKFMQDASDNKIEANNLTGLGDMNLPGVGNFLKEPYTSLVLYILAVIIPIIVLIALMVKKRGLGKNKVVDRSLYVVIIIFGIGGILGGLGILSKVLSNDLGGIKINTDPVNLAIVIGSVLTVITSWFALNFISQAKAASKGVNPTKAPTAREFYDEVKKSDFTDYNSVNDRSDFNAPITPVEMDSAAVIDPSPTSQSDALFERTFTAASVDPTPDNWSAVSLDPPVLMDEPAHSTAAAQTDPLITDSVDGYVQDMPVADVPAAPLPTVNTPLTEAAPIEAESALADIEPFNENESLLETEYSTPVNQVIKPVLKRKLIAFPGDDTKVILVMREFLQDELIREWAEIHAKSEFTNKS